MHICRPASLPLSTNHLTDGYRTRKRYVRNPNDRTKVIGEHGDKPLQIKQYWRFIQKSYLRRSQYEKWTQGEVVKSKFDGLISIGLYNLANRGKFKHLNGKLSIQQTLKIGVDLQRIF